MSGRAGAPGRRRRGARPRDRRRARRRCASAIRGRAFTTTPGALVPAPLARRDRRGTGDGRRADDLADAARAATGSSAAPRARTARTTRSPARSTPATGLRLVDLAEFLCRYARDMRPFDAHATVDMPGDNAAYRVSAARAHARPLPRRLLGAGRRPPPRRGRASCCGTRRTSSSPGPLGRLPRVRAPAPAARPALRAPARRALLARAEPRRRARGAARPAS